MGDAIRVLLIDDEPALGELLRAFLATHASARFELMQEYRLEAGLRRLAEDPPDIALLDLSLPDGLGAPIVAAVVARAPGVPAIVLSGSADEEMLAEVQEEGAFGILNKGEVDFASMGDLLLGFLEKFRAGGNG
jgi:DNA-binding NarL/FixJ family response regulator